MKVRVPGRQFAAAARETPRANKSGNNHAVYFHVTLFDHLLVLTRN